MREKADPTKEQADLLRRETLRRNSMELARRREIGELDKQSFPLENIFYINDEEYENRPLTRNDLGGKALVLTAKEFHQFGYITILLPSGQELDLFADDFSNNPDDPKDVLVIFPGDLGDTAK